MQFHTLFVAFALAGLATAGQGHDWDFGSSPTLFGSGAPPPGVGACNKNGTYYALAANPLSSTRCGQT